MIQFPPRVSICIPVYNGMRFLEAAINSVISQTFSDYEIVIVDDFSCDASYAKVEEFARTNDRIRCYRNLERKGLVGNWNECIKRASGEWIKFLFQDDIMSPDCLEKFVAVSDVDSDISAFFCEREFIYEKAESQSQKELGDIYRNAQFVWTKMPGVRQFDPWRNIEILTRWPEKNVYGEPISFFLKASLFTRYGYFDERFQQYCDLEYWLRIGVTETICLVPETLVSFRVHGQSTTSTNNRENWMRIRYLERLGLFLKFCVAPEYEALRLTLRRWPARKFLHAQAAIYRRRAKIEMRRSGIDVRELDRYCRLFDYGNNFSSASYLRLACAYLFSKMAIIFELQIRRIVHRVPRKITATDDL